MASYRKVWNDGSKQFIPRSRGRKGHSKTYGTNLSRNSMNALCRTAEKRVRQQSRLICNEH